MKTYKVVWHFYAGRKWWKQIFPRRVTAHQTRWLWWVLEKVYYA